MLVLVLLLTSQAAAMPVVKTDRRFCDNAPRKVRQQGVPARVRPLTQEPPAKRLLAVANYDEQGCLKPRIISEQVGPPARR